MPWNQPNKINQKQVYKKKSNKALFFLLSGIFLATIVLMIYKNDTHSLDNPIEQTPKKEKTKIVKQVKQLQNKVASKKEVTEPIKSERPKTLHQQLAKRQFGVGNNVYTTKVNRVKSEFEVFKHRSENHIALLMNVPLGTSLIGNKKYTPRFMDDLKKALDEKVEIFEHDSQEIKNLKLSVEAVKEDIRKMMKKGEDIPKLLTETFNEIQKMGAIKKSLESEIRKANRDSNVSDEDMEVLVQAANKMLEEKGISPISYNPVTRSILRGRMAINAENKE